MLQKNTSNTHIYEQSVLNNYPKPSNTHIILYVTKEHQLILQLYCVPKLRVRMAITSQVVSIPASGLHVIFVFNALSSTAIWHLMHTWHLCED